MEQRSNTTTAVFTASTQVVRRDPSDLREKGGRHELVLVLGDAGPLAVGEARPFVNGVAAR